MLGAGAARRGAARRLGGLVRPTWPWQPKARTRRCLVLRACVDTRMCVAIARSWNTRETGPRQAKATMQPSYGAHARDQRPAPSVGLAALAARPTLSHNDSGASGFTCAAAGEPAFTEALCHGKKFGPFSHKAAPVAPVWAGRPRHPLKIPQDGSADVNRCQSDREVDGIGRSPVNTQKHAS